MGSSSKQPPWFHTYKGHTPTIDPTAWVHPSSVVIGDVTVGAESSLWPHTTLRGDDGPIVIGARTSIQDGTVIHATERLSQNHIGDQVTIGHNCTIHGATVASNCIIGMGSILLDNASIPEFCIVGAGSLVTQGKSFEPHSLILGSPARAVRRLTEKDLQWIEYSWRRYVEQTHTYRAPE